MERCVVIGLGLFGQSVATEMMKHGAEVLAIDSSVELVDQVKDRVTYAVALDATDEQALKDQGVPNFDVAVVSIGENFEAALITTSILKDFGIKRIFARATDRRRERLLKEIGGIKPLDGSEDRKALRQVEVINPEELAGRRVALNLISKEARDVIELTQNFVIVERPVPREFIGRTLRENKIRERYRVNIVAVKKPTNSYDSEGNEVYEIHNSPDPSDLLEDNDRFLIACRKEDADRLPWD